MNAVYHEASLISKSYLDVISHLTYFIIVFCAFEADSPSSEKAVVKFESAHNCGQNLALGDVKQIGKRVLELIVFLDAMWACVNMVDRVNEISISVSQLYCLLLDLLLS